MRRALPCVLLLLAALPAGAANPLSEVFPVAPAVSAQRGFAVALDGDWLAVGAPLEEEGNVKNAGAVYLFHFEDGLWIQRARLVSEHPTEKGRFGHSVALSGETLAVGAAGEEAVHVFDFEPEEGLWLWQQRLAEEGARQFGQAVALDGEWLAISGAPGAVHLFRRAGDDWAESQPVLMGAPGERFGHALSLRGLTLVVGASGADQARGAAYVFELGETGWQRAARLTAVDAAPGDQFGFSVGVEATGEDVVVGAPTADAPGAANGGALYAFRAGGEWEDAQTARLAVTGIDAGDELGYAVAIDGDFVAASAPFGSADLSGSVHVLTRNVLSWQALGTVEADNTGSRDLFGFSAAVRGDRVVAGSMLVDQGGSNAGSAYTFLCAVGPGCSRETELVPSDESLHDRFGIAIDADGDTLVVGSLRGLAPDVQGMVYVYRRAGSGWLQEARLESPFVGARDAFGLAVAISGDMLVVGAPLDNLGEAGHGGPGPSGEPGFIRAGSAHVYRKIDGRWTWQARLTAPSPQPGDGFGRSVAVDGTTVVVGAVGPSNVLGAAYVFEGGQTPGVELSRCICSPYHPFSYGAAVAVSGNTIAVGAPVRAQEFSSAVTLFSRSGTGWAHRAGIFHVSNFAEEGFGAALSIGSSALLVGAPGAPSGGAVYVYDLGSLARQTFSSNGVLLFGRALDLHGDAAVVLGRGDDPAKDTVVAHLFFQTEEGWVDQQVGRAFARPSLVLDADPPFAVAVGADFFAVTAPGKDVGDRVWIFEIPGPELTP
jgi:hypothetical protein